MIALTDRAQAAVARLCLEDPQGRSFRLFIQHKGCSGFTFGFGMDDPLPVDSCQIDGDALLLITTRLAQLVRGGTLDYEADASSSTIDMEQFSFDAPEKNRFEGKFFRHQKDMATDWDRLG